MLSSHRPWSYCSLTLTAQLPKQFLQTQLHTHTVTHTQIKIINILESWHILFTNNKQNRTKSKTKSKILKKKKRKKIQWGWLGLDWIYNCRNRILGCLFWESSVWDRWVVLRNMTHRWGTFLEHIGHLCFWANFQTCVMFMIYTFLGPISENYPDR